MEEMNSMSIDREVVRIDSIYQIEMLNIKDMGSYVYDFLLPNLQMSYKHSKQYLASMPRRNIYCIKKSLADLVEDKSFVKISTSEDIGSEYFTKYEALFMAMDSINLIYSFCVIMKSKLYDMPEHSKALTSLNNILRLIGPVQKEIQNSMEFEHHHDHLNS
ncbi:MAG: hypothetical protein GX660_19720 [Clostridiaceae bacterium]|nr:hypothetical protein [Clostridiaceae bacterium]